MPDNSDFRAPGGFLLMMAAIAISALCGCQRERSNYTIDPSLAATASEVFQRVHDRTTKLTFGGITTGHAVGASGIGEVLIFATTDGMLGVHLLHGYDADKDLICFSIDTNPIEATILSPPLSDDARMRRDFDQMLSELLSGDSDDRAHARWIVDFLGEDNLKAEQGVGLDAE